MPLHVKSCQFKPSMETLGLVLSFICRERPFLEFRAGVIIPAVTHQLSSGSHVCLVEGDRLLAYAGWLPIRRADGERWMTGQVELEPAHPGEADAAALTILSVASPALAAPLLRACRKAAPVAAVFYKRQYTDGRTRKHLRLTKR